MSGRLKVLELIIYNSMLTGNAFSFIWLAAWYTYWIQTIFKVIPPYGLTVIFVVLQFIIEWGVYVYMQFCQCKHECYAIENMSTFPMSLWVPLCNTSSTVSYLSRGTRQEGRIFHETKKWICCSVLLWIYKGNHCMSNSCEYRTSQGSI